MNNHQNAAAADLGEKQDSKSTLIGGIM